MQQMNLRKLLINLAKLVGLLQAFLKDKKYIISRCINLHLPCSGHKLNRFENQKRFFKNNSSYTCRMAFLYY